MLLTFSMLDPVGILGVVALFANKEALIPILVCQSIELYLKNGVNQYSSYPFSSFGFALTMTGDFLTRHFNKKYEMASNFLFREPHQALLKQKS